MTRTILRATWVLILALSCLGCGDSAPTKSSTPAVPDPDGITVPKPAGKGG
jgi:hypothetical protein